MTDSEIAEGMYTLRCGALLDLGMETHGCYIFLGGGGVGLSTDQICQVQVYTKRRGGSGISNVSLAIDSIRTRGA